MKIRTGFISNSSTSSFIICGFTLLDEKNNFIIVSKLLGLTKEDVIAEMKTRSYYKDQEIEEYDIEDFCSEYLQDLNFEKDGFDVEFGEGIEGIIVGKHIVKIDSEDSDLDKSETSLTDLTEITEKVRKKLGISEDISPALYTGTKCC